MEVRRQNPSMEAFENEHELADTYFPNDLKEGSLIMFRLNKSVVGFTATTMTEILIH